MSKLHIINDDIKTILNPGSSIKGDLYITGTIRIDCDIVGNIESLGGVIIGSEARIKANIKALSVIVGGVVEGDIIAPEGVFIESTGLVIGDIITQRLQVQDNVILHGFCISIKDEESFIKAKKKWQDMKVIKSKTFHSFGETEYESIRTT